MRLSKLEPSRRVRGRWLLFLDDGSILRVGENEVVSFGLYAGMEIGGDLQAALTAAGRQGRVREKALDLLAVRQRSRKELIDKLTARPRDREKEPLATAQEAEEAADWLEELGYLNDENYAKNVVEHYSAKGYGPARLRDELYRRGVARECWDAALAEADDPSQGIDAFLRHKLKGEAGDPRALKRAADALARRGYRWEDIKDGLRRYGAEIEEDGRV